MTASVSGPATSAAATGPLSSVPRPAATYGASGGRRGGGRSSQARPARTPTATHAVTVMSRFTYRARPNQPTLVASTSAAPAAPATPTRPTAHAYTASTVASAASALTVRAAPAPIPPSA